MHEDAIVAGGCFWGMQELYRHLAGVIKTTVGYCGGTTNHPTYDTVKNGLSGHAESLKITYDPSVITYREIIQYFFQIHDPTMVNQQGNDRGTQYRSVIFYANQTQESIARTVIDQLNQSLKLPGPIITELIPNAPFFPAEPEHQDYLHRYPQGYTCHWVRPAWRVD